MAKKRKTKKRKEIKDGPLSDLQSLWENREPWTGEGGAWHPPEGEYEGRIGTVIQTVSRAGAGNRQIDWPFTITEGEFEDKEFHDYQTLLTQENLNYVEGRLKTLGIDTPTDINDIGGALEEADGLPVRFRIWYNKEYFNLRIEDVLMEDGKSRGNENEDDNGDDTYTKKEIKAMDEDEKEALARENGLDPDEYTWEELDDELIELLV